MSTTFNIRVEMLKFVSRTVAWLKACLPISTIRPHLKSPMLACVGTLLSACGGTGPYPGVPLLGAEQPARYKGVVAASQVVYRIDENRFFEVVPHESAACYRAAIFYNDIAQGIHSHVMGLDQLGGVELIIDAANTDYLVGFPIKGGGSCYNCGGSWLPYSTDAGRTWRVGGGGPASPGDPLTLSGPIAYAGFSAGGQKLASSVEITKDKFGMRDWKFEPDGFLPKARKSPLDTKFRCIPNGKE